MSWLLFKFNKIKKITKKYPKDNPLFPSIKFDPLIKINKQKEVNNIFINSFSNK